MTVQPALLRPLALFLFMISALGACSTTEAPTQPSAQSIVESLYSHPDQSGLRWGLHVTDLDGNTLLSHRADERFSPASNMKLVTTLAAFHAQDALTERAADWAPSAWLEPTQDADTAYPRLILRSGGDTGLTDTETCQTLCLSFLADAIADKGMTDLHQIVGDDSAFPFEPWKPGWSQEDLQYGFGTAVSALTLNDNVVQLLIEPGAAIGDAPQLSWQSPVEPFQIDNSAITTAPGTDPTLSLYRSPAGSLVEISGTLPADAPPRTYTLGIGDPALLTAQHLHHLLELKGIRIHAPPTSRHRQDVPHPPISWQIAALPPAPLMDSLTSINKDSNNLHAELTLHRLGWLGGTGARKDGLERLDALMRAANIPLTAYDFTDGSGLSIYNRITPRALTQLLGFAQTQDWSDTFKATLPIAGVDGSLRTRFKNTSLEGRLFAKTGTLNGVNALSGYMIAASGETLIFSFIANDRPSQTGSAKPQMDAALEAIANAY